MRAAAFLRPQDRSTPEGRSRERYRLIALTITSGVIARGAGLLVSVIMVPVLFAYLGKEQFGLWSAITATAVWLGAFDLGLGAAMVNVVAEAHGRDDRRAAVAAVSTAFVVLVGMALLLGGALTIAAPRVAWDAVFGARGVIAPHVVRLSVLAAAGGILAGLPFLPTAAVYAGYQQAYVANLFVALGAAATLAAVGATVWWRLSLPAMIAVLAAAAVVVSAASFVYLVRRAMPWLAVDRRLVSTDALGRLMRTAAPLLLFQIGALMVNQSQLFILAHTSDLRTVADYSLLTRVMQIYSGLALVTTGAFLPSYREAMERGDRQWVRAGFARMVAIRLALAGVFAALLVGVGNALMHLWLRRTDVSFPPAVWAALGVFLLAGAWVSAHSDLLTVLDRIWLQVGLVFINGIVTVSLTLWLSPAYGTFGVLVAASAVTICGWTWVYPLLARPLLARPDLEVSAR